jgi:hypothetical protein
MLFMVIVPVTTSKDTKELFKPAPKPEHER